MLKGNRILVAAFIIATFVAWIALDVWLGPNGGPTESMVLRDWGQSHLWFAHMVGVLAGHWFIQRRSTFRLGWMVIIPIWLSLSGWDWWWGVHHAGVHVWYRFSGLWAFAGMVTGAVLWNQQSDESPIP